MIRKYIILLLFLSILAQGCGDNTGVDPSVVGVWTDDNNRYHFQADSRYGVKYLRKGQGQDTILTDSVFGTYVVDTRRNNISFNQEGIVLRPDSLVLRPQSGTTWNYTISGNVLEYRSRTTVGSIFRVNP